MRILAAVAAAGATVAVGLLVSYDMTPDPAGVPAGSNWFMVVLALAFFVGLVAYGLVEWRQTGRVESVARQFSTRTIVLMPVAIAMNVVLGQTTAYALKLPLYLDSIGTILVGVLAGPVAGAVTGLLSNLVWTFVLPPPFESPYAWPFAIVAAEIGFVAGLFGRFGLFRSRPQASTARLVGGIVVAFGLLGALGFWGILPYYRDLCGDGSSGGLCFQLFAPAASVDPALAVLAYVALAVLALGAIGLLLRLVRSRDLGAAFVLVGGATCGVLSALIAYPIAALLGGVSGSGTDLLVAAFQQAGSDLEHAVLQQSLISDPIDKAMTYLIVFLVLGSVSRRVTARFPQGERALGVAADETAARPVPDSRPLEA